MIFVTVGTHEQPFNRLIKKIDELRKKGIIENTVIQIGYSTYIPKYCEWRKMFSYQKMNEFADMARIIITHGGPGCIMLSLQRNKIPIVVPRQKKFGEHVDNHQVLFTERLEGSKKAIAVYDIENLADQILSYSDTCIDKLLYRSNTDHFVAGFEKEIRKLFEGEK